MVSVIDFLFYMRRTCLSFYPNPSLWSECYNHRFTGMHFQCHQWSNRHDTFGILSLSVSPFLFLSVLPRSCWLPWNGFVWDFPHFQRKQSTCFSLETRKVFRNSTCMLNLATILSYQCRNTHDPIFSTGYNSARPVTVGEKILIFLLRINCCVIKTQFVLKKGDRGVFECKTLKVFYPDVHFPIFKILNSVQELQTSRKAELKQNCKQTTD